MKKDEVLDKDKRYKIMEKLGKGGMGEVYRAYDQDLKKDVAIKTLLPESFSDERAADQFRKEVNLTQDFRHENIAATYDLRLIEETPFIVMEYVDGQILTNYIYRQPNNRLDESAFLELANQILNGVGHAHKKGVIHRDLKSGNIMVTGEGEVKILDFGIAANMKETYSKSTGSPITISIHYASPEQINGEEPSLSMDIYSLGCVFYEMLDGEPPFRQGDILHQQLTKPPEPIKHVSKHLNSVIFKSLEKRKEDRFKDVAELKLALQGKDIYITRKIPEARKKSPKPVPGKRRIPWFVKSIAVILFFILVVLGYLLVKFILDKNFSFKNNEVNIQKKTITEAERKGSTKLKKAAPTLESSLQETSFDQIDLARFIKTRYPFFIEKKEISSKIRSIQLTLNSFHFNVKEFFPSDVVPKLFYSEYPLHIQLEGNSSSLLNFLENISKSPKLINPHAITISLLENQSQNFSLSMELVIKLYSYDKLNGKNKLNKEVFEIEKKQLSELREKQQNIFRLFNALYKNIPDYVYLLELKYKNHEMTCKGRALSNIQIADFFDNMENSPNISNVTLVFCKQILEKDNKCQEFYLTAKQVIVSSTSSKAELKKDPFREIYFGGGGQI